MAQHIQSANGVASAWTAADPILQIGEIGIETDTGLMKVGDGVTTWTSLGYFAGGVGASAPPVTLASAATVDIGAAGSNFVNITGAVTITSFGSVTAGTSRTVIFAGVLTLTYNATSLIIPGSSNVSTTAGDVAVFVSLGGGNWRCTDYMRANGTALVSSGTFQGGTLTSPINDAPEVTVASASTTDIGAAASNQVTISGTVTILGLGTIASGASRRVTFSGVLTITHNASSLILPGGASITTAAGDTAEFQSLGGGNWRCVDYQKASGQAVVGGAFTGGTLTTALNEAPIATLASAGTVNIGASVNSISISGTTSITAFDTIASGAIRRLVFQGILTLTHNATTLILPQGANITTAAGDVAEFVSLGSGNWRCFNYMRASGVPIGAAPVTLVVRAVAGTSDTILATDNGGIVDYTNAGAIAVAITTAFNGLSTQLTWPASAGTITITPTGVTLNGAGSAIVLSAALGSVAVIATGANAFRVIGSIGDLVAADVTDSGTTGRAVLQAADAVAGRAALSWPSGTTVSASRALATTDVNKITRVDTGGGAVVLTLNSATITAGQVMLFQRNGANSLTFASGTATVDNPDSVTVADKGVVAVVGSLITAGNAVLA